MSDEEESNEGLEVVSFGIDLSAPVVGGVVTTATGNPVLGGAAAMVAKVTSVAIDFVKRRRDQFAHEAQAALPPKSEISDDVIFQNYRRALDATDEAVIPALARLTAEYSGRHADSFMRGVGRILEDLSSDELFGFRQLVSGAVTTCEEIVEVTPWTAANGAWEVRFTTPRSKGDRLVWGMPWPAGLRRLLNLLERNDLTAPRAPTGVDLEMRGSYTFERVTLLRLERILLPVVVDVRRSSFDRASAQETGESDTSHQF